MYPASTSTVFVLPLKTDGRAHFSLDNGPMPASLLGRLAETEYLGVVERVNKLRQTRAQHRQHTLTQSPPHAMGQH